ncbi:hypothetical protein AVEN_239036-1 [Araneus ventricosus]|uniref:Uncharacterized protein n=1 Tax=Araneus ventricosus TaxID=182803 RepID=A0A4Y2PJ70_ARAVE|nr:hypothetical protein AVEN_239036-1 [Araneus ventricosus]
MSNVADTQRVGFTIIWKIENFSLVPKLSKTELIRSPSFTADNLDKTSWYLLLYPVGFSQDNRDTFLSKLHKNSGRGPNWISLDYELSILYKADSEEKPVTVRRFCCHASNAYGKPVFIAPHDIFNRREILPGDTLTVLCKMWHHEITCLEPGFSMAQTRIGTQRKSFSWQIDKFSTLQVGDKKSVIVELFYQQELLYITITLFLTGGPASGEKVQIKIEGRNQEKISPLMLGISVQNANGESTQHFQNEFILGKEHKEFWFPLILERRKLIEDKNLLLPGDVLSLKCDMKVYDVISNRIEVSAFGDSSAFDLEAVLTNTNRSLRLGKRKRHSSSNCLTHEMRHLFEEKQHADVSLRVHNETFPVHKAILAARSTVFKTMFDTDMKEKFTNPIVIDDIDTPDVYQTPYAGCCYTYTVTPSTVILIGKMLAICTWLPTNTLFLD